MVCIHRSSAVLMVPEDITNFFAQARKSVRTMRTCLFREEKYDYIPLLIKEKQFIIMLKNRQIAVISTVSVMAFLVITIGVSNMDALQAYAGVTFSNDNVAKTIQVKINPVGTNIAKTFDSFSRVGFVSGDSNFLLESVPSLDKKPFYSIIKKALEQNNPLITTDRINVSIELYSGNGELIQTLLYKDCDVTEYFVHGIDSRGKIFFAPNEGEVEIREVTKFACTTFTLDIDYEEEEIQEILETIEYIDRSPFEIETEDGYYSRPSLNATEGELYYNSMTNKLQKFKNGTWVDISGVGGPPTPRR